MVRVGLVAYVEEQLERAISLGQMHPSGQFGSEEKLARSYGVSRSTVREALRRLAARGLVVQHPGRKTRLSGAALKPPANEPGGECAGGDPPGEPVINLSDSPTGSCASPPEEALQPESPPAGSREPTGLAVRAEDETLLGIRGQPLPLAIPEGCAPQAPRPPLPQPHLSPEWLRRLRPHHGCSSVCRLPRGSALR